jgi:hypothetical protein
VRHLLTRERFFINAIAVVFLAAFGVAALSAAGVIR